MNWWTKARTFWTETRSEMKKVTFPTRPEVINTTVVVLIASFVFAVYLYVADFVIIRLYEFVVNFFS